MAKESVPTISTADATASPAEYTKANGQVVTLYPVTIGGVGKWERYMKQCVIDTAMASVRSSDEITEAMARVVTSEAHKAASAMSFGTPQAQAFLSSFDGMLYFVYLSLRENPKWTGDGVEAASAVVDTFEDLAGMVELVLGMSGLVDKKKMAAAASADADQSDAAKNDGATESDVPSVDGNTDGSSTNGTHQEV